jgi:signal transduction histidine kinase
MPESFESERKSLRTIFDSSQHLIELLNKILDFEKVSSTAEFELESLPFSVPCEAERVRPTAQSAVSTHRVTRWRSGLRHVRGVDGEQEHPAGEAL